MQLTSYQFEILYYIYRHPYVHYDNLAMHFSKKRRYKPPLFSTWKYNDARFMSTVDGLKNRGFLFYTCYSCLEDDTGQIYPQDNDIASFENFHDGSKYAVFIRTSESGDAFLYNRFLFWLPWGVTTLIAITNLIVSIFGLLLTP